MKTYTLEIHLQDDAGQTRKHGAGISVTATDVDAAAKQARALVTKHGLPAIRTLNFTPDGKIVVYCAEKVQRRPGKANEQVVWRRPAGERRI